MKFSTILASCTLSLAAASPIACPTAHTKYGTVKGTHLDDAVDGFLGVPYAKPPLGGLRFKPPQPLDKASGTIDASKFGNVCHQFHYDTV